MHGEAPGGGMPSGDSADGDQEERGGPRGEALDRSTRRPGMALASAAACCAERAGATPAGCSQAVLVKGSAATAQSGQQSRSQPACAAPPEWPAAGMAWSDTAPPGPDMPCRWTCAGECASSAFACACPCRCAPCAPVGEGSPASKARETVGPSATPQMAIIASHASDFRRSRSSVMRRLWRAAQACRVLAWIGRRRRSMRAGADRSKSPRQTEHHA